MIIYYTLPIAIAFLLLAIFYSFKASKASKSSPYGETLKWRTRAMFSGFGAGVFGFVGALATSLQTT